jgi:putative endonuclease
MFYTYIIYSKTANKYYVGASENPAERLKKHNSKNSGFTNRASDWKIMFIKEFSTKSDALCFEKKIKSWKSRKKIEELIQNNASSEHSDENFV